MAAVFFIGGMLAAGDGATELAMLLDSARADIDGDGVVTQTESIGFEIMLGTLNAENPVWIPIVLAYGNAMDKPEGSPVDLSFLWDMAASPEEGGAIDGPAPPTGCACTVFIRGDANNNNAVNIADPVYLLSYMYQSGPAPVPLDAGDANDDGQIDLGDYTFLIAYLRTSGPKPPLPFGPVGGPYFEGLDPTPDPLNNSCDLLADNFTEAHPGAGEYDFTGDGVDDALWLVPEKGDVMLEETDGLYAVPYATGLRTAANDYTPFSLLVSRTGVVYVLASRPADGASRVHVLQDKNGDGDAGDLGEASYFWVSSNLLDAVLTDGCAGGVSGVQELVTLHRRVDGKESLVAWTDSNGDGWIDGSAYETISAGVLNSPQALAVDPRTGRIFVSGVDGAGVPAVVFYKDTDGDKRIESGSSTTYLLETAVPGADSAYVGLSFMAAERTLLVLALGDSAASVLCVKDQSDDVFTWQQVVRSSSFPLGDEDAPGPRWIDSREVVYQGLPIRTAFIVYGDGWSVIVMNGGAGLGGVGCFEALPADIPFGALPDAARMEADKYFGHWPYVVVEGPTDWGICEEPDECNKNFTEVTARYTGVGLAGDMRELLTVYEDHPAGIKDPDSKAKADEYGPDPLLQLTGRATYKWYDGDTTTHCYVWVEPVICWDIRIAFSGFTGAPILSTMYKLSGKIDIDVTGDQYGDSSSEFFDSDGVDPDPGQPNDALEFYDVTYFEGYSTPSGWWSPPDGAFGRWDGGDGALEREDAAYAEVGPGSPFYYGVTMAIDVDRGGTAGVGAGNREDCDYKVLLRIRCSATYPLE
ncbi:MAG TPA: hypothetical protein DCM87_03530 [Planctomycetes bacterium]|nr:hypothetical protein [Planctomycetota bacterium]